MLFIQFSYEGIFPMPLHPRVKKTLKKSLPSHFVILLQIIRLLSLLWWLKNYLRMLKQLVRYDHHFL